MRLSTRELKIIYAWMNCYELLDESENEPFAKQHNKDMLRITNKIGNIIQGRSTKWKGQK